MKHALIQLPFYSFLMKIRISKKSVAGPSCVPMLTRWPWLCFPPSVVPGCPAPALGTLCSRDVVAAESPWREEVAEAAAEEEECCFAGSQRHLLFTEADHSPSTLKWKQAPLSWENVWIDWGPAWGKRPAGADSCLGCIITGSGAEVLELLLEAKNSRKVDVLSKIVQICG